MEKTPSTEKPKPRSRARATTPAPTRSNQRINQPEQVVITERDPFHISWKKIGGSILALSLAGGGAGLYFWYKEFKQTAAENEMEAILYERGFSEAGVAIEVHGGGETIDIACDTGKSVSDSAYFTMQIIKAGELALQLPSPNLVDVDGRILESFDPKIFPVETRDQLEDFINGSEREKWCKKVTIDS